MAKSPTLPAKPLRSKTVASGFKVSHRPPVRKLANPARLKPIAIRATKKR